MECHWPELIFCSPVFFSRLLTKTSNLESGLCFGTGSRVVCAQLNTWKRSVSDGFARFFHISTSFSKRQRCLSKSRNTNLCMLCTHIFHAEELSVQRKKALFSRVCFSLNIQVQVQVQASEMNRCCMQRITCPTPERITNCSLA